MARVLQGVSAAVVWTVGLALVLDTVGPENLGKTIGSVCFCRLEFHDLTFFFLTGIMSRSSASSRLESWQLRFWEASFINLLAMEVSCDFCLFSLFRFGTTI